MKTSEFEKMWSDFPGDKIGDTLKVFEIMRAVTGESYDCIDDYLHAAQKQPERYTEKLMEVCGMELREIEDVRSGLDYVCLEDVEKIATADEGQRLKAAGLTGCEDG